MSLPVFAVGSATGCRCLPVFNVADGSATDSRFMPLMLLFLTQDMLSEGHCLPFIALDAVFWTSVLACCDDVTAR
ncbi:hypothetical protein TNIN_191591 [Trichonephila inaurata madagascariensis]|uniref:Uncharacterized protein n=1 Tax=Trichonephila inaurata madagascariensis TaxID=2747483 RepID=A0A8X6XCX7_9ARAC|nr:hypothetical protein TNIN_191591 [Trichonephila inaurata madagascariensis]